MCQILEKTKILSRILPNYRMPSPLSTTLKKNKKIFFYQITVHVKT
jgi:hypothetical protein